MEQLVVGEIILDEVVDTVDKCNAEGPCFIVEGLIFKGELLYLDCSENPEWCGEGLPLYLFDGSDYKLVCDIAPTLYNIRRMRFIGCDVRFLNSDNEELDLTNPTVLLKFIDLV